MIFCRVVISVKHLQTLTIECTQVGRICKILQNLKKTTHFYNIFSENYTCRYMVPYRKTRTYKPVKLIRITIDLLSLIPYYEVYYFLGRISLGKGYQPGKNLLRWKIFLRLHTVVEFLVSLDKVPGANHLIIATITHVVTFVLYITFMSAVWYKLADWIPENNWTQNLNYHKVDLDNELNWFILSFGVIGNMYAHNWTGETRV